MTPWMRVAAQVFVGGFGLVVGGCLGFLFLQAGCDTESCAGWNLVSAHWKDIGVWGKYILIPAAIGAFIGLSVVRRELRRL